MGSLGIGLAGDGGIIGVGGGSGGVTVPPSGDTTGATDRTNIQNAMNAVGATGGTVQLLTGLGKYYLNNHLLWDTSANANAGLAPSILGTPGFGGTDHSALVDVGAVEIVAVNSGPTLFPNGEFMIDYIGPAPVGGAAGNIGHMISGLRLMCQGRAAGIRDFNASDSTWQYLVLDTTRTPSPANTAGNPLGAVNFLSSPSYESINMMGFRIYVYQAGSRAFHCNVGGGNLMTLLNCEASNSTGSGFEIYGNGTLIGCQAQNNSTGAWGGADYKLFGGGQLIGCSSVGSTYGNAIQYLGQTSIDTQIIGGSFIGTARAGGTEAQTAIVRVVPNNPAHAVISGSSFNNQQVGGDYIYVDATVTGSVLFTGCEFYGTTPTTPVNVNATTVLTVRDCIGINTIDAAATDTKVSGHIVSTATGTPATSNLGANVTSATFTGNDTRGTLAIVMSAGLAANTRVCTATFATTYGATAPKVSLIDQTSTAGLAIVNSYVMAGATGAAFDIAFDQALVAGTYTIDYIIIG